MSDQMQALREYYPLSIDKKLLESSRGPDGRIILQGIFQRANTLNQNGRIYPLSILQREVVNYQKLIKERRATGELDHPDTSVVELKNVSHVVTELIMKGEDVWGKLEILSTPSGNIAKSLIESSITLGISSRGVGSTISKGSSQIVQDDFQLICFDLVSEPSTPGAFMGALSESVSRKDLNKFFTKEDRVFRILNDILSQGR